MKPPAASPRELLPVPQGAGLLVHELHRIEREQPRTSSPAARRLLAIERRRVVLALDRERGATT